MEEEATGSQLLDQSLQDLQERLHASDIDTAKRAAARMLDAILAQTQGAGPKSTPYAGGSGSTVVTTSCPNCGKTIYISK